MQVKVFKVNNKEHKCVVNTVGSTPSYSSSAAFLYRSFIVHAVSGLLELHSKGTAQQAFCFLGQRYIIQASSPMLCPCCEASPQC